MRHTLNIKASRFKNRWLSVVLIFGLDSLKDFSKQENRLDIESA